ncbi:MAG: hypothetical protein PVF68_08135 [Acidobacteriota bacterium]
MEPDVNTGGWIRRTTLLLAAGSVLLGAMALRLGPEVADDGAFFLRYAENLAAGDPWVWNPREPPVWGASAPLFPVVLALPIVVGLPTVPSAVGISLLLAASGLLLVAWLLGTRFGALAGTAFVILAALDTELMYYAAAGLETPLTVAWLALAIWVLLGDPPPWAAGAVAGFLAVQKLDLLPAAALLLAAHGVRRRRLPGREAVIAAAIGLAWYGFAWLHFGAPVPNAFLTKLLHQGDLRPIIDASWFRNLVLKAGVHEWLAGLSLLAVLRWRRQLAPLGLFLGGLLLTHLIAYTLWHPFEPYNWYGIPSVLSLLVLGSIGLAATGDLLRRRLPRAAIGLPVLLLVAVIADGIPDARRTTAEILGFASHEEHDRAEAGRWVQAHTPEDFVVYTMWGNPAYHSGRRVIDGSFLNRPFEPGDPVARYRPEVLILQNEPGSTPARPAFAATDGTGYTVVRVFDRSYRRGIDYFFAVLVRDDVLGDLRP